MVNLPLLLAFLAAAAILTVTPGIDTVLVLRAATANGRRPAAHAALGVALGCLIWGGAVSLGLGAILRASELAYAVVKIAGAAYLLWLGAKLLFRPRVSLYFAVAEAHLPLESGAFRRGFLTNLLNPKVGVFYVTFLPQFVPAGTNVAGYSFFLACLHVVLSLCWFAALIAATAPLGRFLRRPGAMKIFDRLTGAVFVGFGVKLAVSSAR